jgi:hypothetical protein
MALAFMEDYKHLYPESKKETMRKLSKSFGTILELSPKEEGQPSSVTDPSTR